jgi:hypothetical protein
MAALAAEVIRPRKFPSSFVYVYSFTNPYPTPIAAIEIIDLARQ